MKIIAAIVAFLSTAAAFGEARSAELFKGKDLSGWSFYLENNADNSDGVFTVKDGAICVKGKPFGYIYTDKKYSDFRLRLEWKYTGELTNSGIFVFV